MLGLKSTGWCVRGCWLTICAVQTSFFLAVAALECVEIFVDVYRRYPFPLCGDGQT